MTIAIPTNDKKTLAKRTGQAQIFAYFQVENGKVINAFFKDNPQKHEHHHHGKEEHHHSHPEILKILEGVDLVLVKNIGKYMKADFVQNGINYLKIAESDLESAVKEYLKNNQ